MMSATWTWSRASSTRLARIALLILRSAAAVDRYPHIVDERVYPAILMGASSTEGEPDLRMTRSWRGRCAAHLWNGAAHGGPG
jgi:hypothetical protein